MSSMSDDDPVLVAALTLFARHGFQRTSMADIAREAGIARATLYLRHRDKRAVFEALAARQVAAALAGAEAAWTQDGDPAANIEAAILGKDLGFFHLLNETPHGAELLAVDAVLTRGHVAALDTGFVAIMARRAEGLAAAGSDLSAFGGAEGFGLFLATAGAGLKHECRDEAQYRNAVRRLARVAARATRPEREVA